MIQKKYLPAIVVFAFMLGIIVFATISKGNYFEEIENNKGTTICKYTYCYHHTKTSTARFRYYIDGVKYKNGGGSCPDNYRDKLKHFYVMHYSTYDPTKIDVDFSREVTDTTAILKAGFSLEELGRDDIEVGEK